MVIGPAQPSLPHSGVSNQAKGGAEALLPPLFHICFPFAGSSFPAAPVSKSPMVEQAVQTGSVDSLTAKKLLPAKGIPVTQLNGRLPQPSKPSSGTTPDPNPLSADYAYWGLTPVLAGRKALA